MKNTSIRARSEGILYTDQYQLTMAHLYYRMGVHETPAQFEHFFRSYPDYGNHKAGYCINAGLAWLLEWMESARFTEESLEPMRTQRGRTGARLFQDDFLEWLKKNGDFSGITMRAIPEGRVVHPHVPLNVVQGPLAMAQILETSLLNQLNFPTLIATKAARIKESAHGGTVLEFGLRRAHERGATAGARAALIGGAEFTSYVGVSHALGVDPKGTHAHSMVQTFMAMGEGELGAFRAYADVYPDDCLLLVDTIDTLESGVPHAIRVFEELRRKGHEPVGIRLDSGDLAYLSIQAACMLDKAGFPDTSIVLSNELDELVVWQIVTQIQKEAPRYGVEPDKLIKRLVYGVGTRLITSAGSSSLNGVYKMVALCRDGVWLPAIKISETRAKTINPGYKHVWRIYDQLGKASADLLSLNGEDPREMPEVYLQHPTNPHKSRVLGSEEISNIEPLLVEVLSEGRQVYEIPDLEAIRAQRRVDVERLHPGVTRIIFPHIYHVSLTKKLWDLKQSLTAAAREEVPL